MKTGEERFGAIDLAMARRDFLKYSGAVVGAAATGTTLGCYLSSPPVYVVRNGDFHQNISKLLELMGGISTVVGPTDVVVIKGNGQWPNRGYTHTGCIKAVIDHILSIPGFEGEVLICDNVQAYGSAGAFGFDATEGNRGDNWPDHNWNSLAAEYQASGHPVATHRWISADVDAPPKDDITGPADGAGWIRSFFKFFGVPTYLSYPVFESPLTAGRMIDMKRGVWEDGSYTGRKVRKIFMPTLNYHGTYAGVTSAVKSFFGATEIIGGAHGRFRGAYNIHGSSYHRDTAIDGFAAGLLTARYMEKMYAPDLFVTAAIYTGHNGRWRSAVRTNTVLACAYPATLDFVACRDVIAPISPHGAVLDPTLGNVTWWHLLGCSLGGGGPVDPGGFEIVDHTF